MQFTPYNQTSLTVTKSGAGVSEVVTNLPNPCTIALQVAGGTATVEYTVDPEGTIWASWGKGTVSGYDIDKLTADVLGVRINVTSGDAIMQLVGGRHV